MLDAAVESVQPRVPVRSTMNPDHVGPFAILEKLGSGGMGTVYLGRHAETQQLAAVKVLPASLARESGFVERFEREIDAMRQLQSPHIVMLYDSGQDQETLYYSMEYVPGETLMTMLKRERRIPWPKAVDMAIQICHALKAAHDAGIIHRDLKPSNLLVTPEGVVKLTDFGVAQVFAAQRLTVTGGIIGTAEFMSPEQAQGKRVSKHSDLYSLGAVMYCMVTGRPPFSGNTAIDVIQKHRFALFDRPRLTVPDLPILLDDVICQLLEKEPEKRFPDARVLSRRLEVILDREENPATLAASYGSDISDITLAEGLTADPNDATIASDFTANTRTFSSPRHGPATLMSQAIREELQQDETPLSLWLNNTWVLATALVLVCGSVLWLATRPSAPAAEPSNESEDLDARLMKLKLLLNANRPLVSSDDAARQLLKAQDLARQGDLESAHTILTALMVLLGNDKERVREKELAELFLKRLEDQTSGERYAALRSALKRAAKLESSGDTQGAQKIRQSARDLFGADVAAKRLIEETGK